MPVGLTGNHMNDFGHENDLASLALYAKKGIPVYAAGANAEAARKPAILEHNGNRLAFLGANQWGPASYINGLGQQVSEWAGPDTPGSARFDRDLISDDIRAAKTQADLVFAEVQHTETNGAGDYVTEPIPLQEADFRAMSDAGADVVTGVQAHAPQAVELRNGRLILYGLGNLFFDQTTIGWNARTWPGAAPHDLRRQADQHRTPGDCDPGRYAAPLGDPRRTHADAADRVRREPVVNSQPRCSCVSSRFASIEGTPLRRLDSSSPTSSSGTVARSVRQAGPVQGFRRCSDAF